MAAFDRAAMTALALMLLSAPTFAAEPGDAARGERVYRVCAACHSLEPNRSMTGPSLAELWGRKAGGLANFNRYSPALKSSGIIWDDTSLDPWLKDPHAFITGNTMTFPGIKDDRQRADLLAYLKEATQPGRAPSTRHAQRSDGIGGMGGMMEQRSAPKLKKLAPEERVRSITHCSDTYRVTTADGKTRAFWERNLRFKTDASDEGPEKGAPAIIGAGMMGDRASVIFAAPDEIGGFITQQC